MGTSADAMLSAADAMGTVAADMATATAMGAAVRRGPTRNTGMQICYQRLSLDDTGTAHCLHGLTALRLPGVDTPQRD